MENDGYPDFYAKRFQEAITEDAKAWSIGARFMWGIFLVVGALAMLIGSIGNIPSTGSLGSPEMVVTTLRNFLRIFLGI